MLTTQYRPSTFGEVVGQDLAKQTLKAIAKSDGIKVRAILLQGSFGSGKTTLSRIFAKAVNCEQFKKTGEVCNKCEACLDAERASSQAYKEYDATRVGNVESIKSLIDSLQIKNYDGRRVVCIDEVHTASRQAQSALLKVLEDGIPNTFMVFATTDAVINTIKSRSVLLEVTTLPTNLIVERLKFVSKTEGIEITDEQLEIVAMKSQGHMRDALSILEHYQIAGKAALGTSLVMFRKLILALLRKEDYNEIITSLLQYPLADIQNSIKHFLAKCFTAENGFESQIRRKGISMKLFRFFYTPEAQQALKDEAGVEILLRALAESL